MKNVFIKLLLLACCLFSVQSYAQNKPFWNEIRNFQKSDSIAMPAAHSIVFTGSSSIRLWSDLEQQYREYPVINRGFGGSTLAQANDYIQDLVLKYKPRQVVIYSGENDIAEGTTGKATFDRFVIFFKNLRKALPSAPIEYISIKQSPSRVKFTKEVLEANSLIKTFLSKQKNSHFIDVNTLMLDAKGQLRPELFREDMLHMKPEGYAIWTKAITPYLIQK